MKHLLKSVLLLALFGFAASFTTQETATAEATESQSKIVFNLNVIQPQQGIGTIGMTWQATTQGPYWVLILDVTNGGMVVVANLNTPNLFHVQNNLTVGHTYRVQVSDNNNNVFQFITIQ